MSAALNNNTLGVGGYPAGCYCDNNNVWVALQRTSHILSYFPNTGILTNFNPDIVNINVPTDLSNNDYDGFFIYSDNNFLYLTVNIRNSSTSFILQYDISSPLYPDSQPVGILSVGAKLIAGICGDKANIWFTCCQTNQIGYFSTNEVINDNITSVNYISHPRIVRPQLICSNGKYVWFANNGDNITAGSSSISQINAETFNYLGNLIIEDGYNAIKGEYNVTCDNHHVWVTNNYLNSTNSSSYSYIVSFFSVWSNFSDQINHPVYYTSLYDNPNPLRSTINGVYVDVVNTLSPSYNLNFPQGIYSDGNNVWIANSVSNQIVQLNANPHIAPVGKYIDIFYIQPASNFYSVFSNGKYVWITDNGIESQNIYQVVMSNTRLC
jgi:hypothetical protein